MGDQWAGLNLELDGTSANRNLKCQIVAREFACRCIDIRGAANLDRAADNAFDLQLGRVIAVNFQARSPWPLNSTLFHPVSQSPVTELRRTSATIFSAPLLRKPKKPAALTMLSPYSSRSRNMQGFLVRTSALLPMRRRAVVADSEYLLSQIARPVAMVRTRQKASVDFVGVSWCCRTGLNCRPLPLLRHPSHGEIGEIGFQDKLGDRGCFPVGQTASSLSV